MKNFWEENARVSKQAAKDFVNRKYDGFLMDSANPSGERSAMSKELCVQCRDYRHHPGQSTGGHPRAGIENRQNHLQSWRPFQSEQNRNHKRENQAYAKNAVLQMQIISVKL